MNEQSPTLRRLTERPFGAAQDPAKPVRSYGPMSAAAGGATSVPATGTTAPAPTIPRPTRTLGDTHTWTPTLNNGTDRAGTPVYDNTSVQRMIERRSDLSGLQDRPGSRPDFSNVRNGATAAASPTALRSMNDAGVAIDVAGVPVLRRTLDPPPVIARPDTGPKVQSATTRAVGAINANTASTRGRVTSALLNPMGNDAELVRRLENSQRSAAGRGSPQARRLLAQPYLDALSIANKAEVDGMTAGNQTFSQAPALEAAAHESAARRTLEADTFNVDASYRERALATEAATRRAELDRPSLQTDAEGNLLQVSGTTASPVRGNDGTPVRAARPATARDHQVAADDKLLAELIGMQKDEFGEYPADALETARQQLAEIRSGQRVGDTQPQAPRAGDVLDGFRFRGGDPSNPENWEAQ